MGRKCSPTLKKKTDAAKSAVKDISVFASAEVSGNLVGEVAANTLDLTGTLNSESHPSFASACGDTGRALAVAATTLYKKPGDYREASKAAASSLMRSAVDKGANQAFSSAGQVASRTVGAVMSTEGAWEEFSADKHSKVLLSGNVRVRLTATGREGVVITCTEIDEDTQYVLGVKVEFGAYTTPSGEKISEETEDVDTSYLSVYIAPGILDYLKNGSCAAAEQGACQVLGAGIAYGTGLPIVPSGFINTGKERGVEFIGGHKASYGVQCRENEKAKEVKKGLHVRVGDHYIGAVGVNVTLGTCQYQEKTLLKNSRAKIQLKDTKGVSVKADFCGIDVGQACEAGQKKEMRGVTDTNKNRVVIEGQQGWGVSCGDNLGFCVGQSKQVKTSAKEKEEVSINGFNAKIGPLTLTSGVARKKKVVIKDAALRDSESNFLSSTLGYCVEAYEACPRAVILGTEIHPVKAAAVAALGLECVALAAAYGLSQRYVNWSTGNESFVGNFTSDSSSSCSTGTGGDSESESDGTSQNESDKSNADMPAIDDMLLELQDMNVMEG